MNSKIKVLHIKVDHQPEVIELVPDLGTLQDLVGGYIETHRTRLQGVSSYINEEGRLMNLKENVVASRIMGVSVVGDVVILVDDRSLTQDEIDRLLAFASA
jgi:hypothetical protein